MKLTNIFLGLMLCVLMAGSAAAAVTYSCDGSIFETSRGIVLSDFSTISEWSTTGTGTATSSTYSLHGDNSVRISCTAQTSIASTNISRNFSNDENIVLYYYVENVSNVSSVFMWMGTYTNGTKYEARSLFPYRMRNGWNSAVVRLSDFVAVGNDSWENTKIKMHVGVTPVNGTTAVVYFDQIGYNYNTGGKPTIFFTFDDGKSSTYNLAYPIMKKYGFAGTSYVIPANVNTSTYMTLSQLKELQAAGWDISSHSWSHQNLATLSDNDLNTQLTNSRSWLVGNGFGKAAYSIAIPFGSYNQNVLNRVSENYILGRSSIESYYETYPLVDVGQGESPQLTVKSFYPTASTYSDTSRFNTTVDRCMDQNGMVVLMFHQLTENPANEGEYVMTTAHFESICQYIASKGASVQVLPMSALIKTNIPNNTALYGKSVTISANGHVTEMPQPTRNDIAVENLLIYPAADVIVNISSWTGSQKSWTESSKTQQTITHLVRGLPANTTYSIYRDGQPYDELTANTSGVAVWTYSGGFSDHTFELISTNSLNVISTNSSSLAIAATDVNVNSNAIQTGAVNTEMWNLYSSVTNSISSGYTLAGLIIIVLAGAGIMRFLGYL